jgi:hypothetical protein
MCVQPIITTRESQVERLSSISIITPISNGLRTLDRSIASIKNQTHPHWELLAVDDASTDESFNYLQTLSQQDPRIRVFRSDENRGPGAARNLGLRHATADMVVYLDCDDEFHPHFLAHVHRLRDRADILIFGYDYMEEGKPASTTQFWDPTPFGALFFEQNISTPLGVAHKRELWSRVGGFDETLWCQEDWEFWKRLARTGAEVLYIPISSGLYRFRPGSRSQSPRVTASQFAAYEVSRNSGQSLYPSSIQPSRRPPVQRIAFASPYLYLDPTHPGAVSGASLLELLAGSGFTCQAFSGAMLEGLKDGDIERCIDEQSLRHQSTNALRGPFAARLIYTCKANVPVTLVQPKNTQQVNPRIEIINAFLAFYETFLDTFKPDVLITHSANPLEDPIIRLAKRRDIPVVMPLLDFPYPDRHVFFNVDYCLVPTETLRQRYWENLGLACVTLPPPDNEPKTRAIYADFFRKIHPQPGPPFVPALRES